MSKTYAQLAREISALQAAAQKQLAVESKGAVSKINEMIVKYNLSASDLAFVPSVSGSVKPKPSKAAKGKAAAGAGRARYGDGTGNVWGGRGPRPAWLRSALAGGRAIESFLTGSEPAVQMATSGSAAVAQPVPKKSASKSASGKSTTTKKKGRPAIKSPMTSAVQSTPAVKSAAAKKSVKAKVAEAPPSPAAKDAAKSGRMKKGSSAAPGRKTAAKKAPAAKKTKAARKATVSTARAKTAAKPVPQAVVSAPSAA